MSPTTRSVAQSGVTSAVSVYMRQVYQWMTAGLALTTVVAYGVANSPAIRDAILGNSLVMILLIVAQIRHGHRPFGRHPQKCRRARPPASSCSTRP